MPSCNICIDELRKPVSLPCGHIFCTDCIIKTVQAIKPLRTIHPCPICRSSYNVAPINPALVPPHLRSHITPSIRRVYVDSTPPCEPQPPCPKRISDELTRLQVENHTLRMHCVSWRRRAELHGAATLGLLDFSRMVRDRAMNLSHERDELQKECNSLKRKLEDRDRSSEPVTQWRNPSSPKLLHSGRDSSSTDTSQLAVSALLELQSCMAGPHSSLEPGLELYSQTVAFHTTPSSSSPIPLPASDMTHGQSDLEPAKKRLRRHTPGPHSTSAQDVGGLTIDYGS